MGRCSAYRIPSFVERFADGVTSQFAPFEADISPRCEEMKKILEEMSQGGR